MPQIVKIKNKTFIPHSIQVGSFSVIAKSYLQRGFICSEGCAGVLNKNPPCTCSLYKELDYGWWRVCSLPMLAFQLA